MVNSNQKGKRGEREFVRFLAEAFGIRARRSQQFCGRPGTSADVVCDTLPGIHFEVKRVEKLNIDQALAQAKEDCLEGKVPVVVHRKNGGRWMTTFELTRENIERLVAEYERSKTLP